MVGKAHPRIEAVFDPTGLEGAAGESAPSVLGTFNPGDPVSITYKGAPLAVEANESSAAFRAPYQPTPGPAEVCLTTSKGYRDCLSVFHNRVTLQDVEGFNPYNDEEATLTLELAAPDRLVATIVKGSLQELQSLALPADFDFATLDPNNLPSELAQIQPVRLLVGATQEGGEDFGLPFEAGTHTLTWDGRDDAGNLVEPGVYTLTVMAFSTDKTYASFPFATMELEVFKSPVIREVTTTLSSLDAVSVSWTTDVPSTGRVEFAPCPLGSEGCTSTFSPGTIDLATQHTIVLVGLQQGATYTYRIHATADTGEQSVSRLFSFEVPKLMGDSHHREAEDTEATARAAALAQPNAAASPPVTPDFLATDPLIALGCCCASCPFCPPPYEGEEGNLIPPECCRPGPGPGGGPPLTFGSHSPFHPPDPDAPVCEKEKCPDAIKQARDICIAAANVQFKECKDDCDTNFFKALGVARLPCLACTLLAKNPALGGLCLAGCGAAGNPQTLPPAVY